MRHLASRGVGAAVWRFAQDESAATVAEPDRRHAAVHR